ncbi:hypothetical protein Cgig2_024491 [Carnegiea gigantea]|uniref:Protein EFR3 homolog B n=1 Tax=Carnegiea gigantea TaxID=171969 RepID=A0A9Q1KLS6_9CARY|nr:hypothetical protein Cgig2_024491 [Carnegiea gigantea]
MGVMSRRVLPACGSLCFCCPALRTRSRQPVKRYKKLLANIFPRNQEADPKPNDRMIGKLCEYASKNPLRIPKIAEYLEQRFYKDLRNGHGGSAKVVLCIYRKLLSSCKEQMPLFACSLLGIIQTLSEQTSQEEMQILACNALVDFIDVQVRFMAEQSHIPLEFDKIISVTLDNFAGVQTKPENGKLDRQPSQNLGQSVQGAMNTGDAPTPMELKSMKQLALCPVNSSESPPYWSKVCLHNMTALAKRATTVRRVLEPIFLNFDSEDYWSPESGLACSVLMHMQQLLEESGENCHVLLSILVKHLDHKNIVKQPLKQINIIHVITRLAQNAKKQATVAITGALTDLLRHLRKCMQYSAEASSAGTGADKLNSDLLLALEKCISQLSDKNFPDGLFHQVLLAMGHPDVETRITAHRVFSTILMPSLMSPWSGQKELASQNSLRLPLVLPMKVKSGSFSIPEGSEAKAEAITTVEEIQRLDNEVKQSQVRRSHSKSYSFKSAMTNGKMELASLRLSTHQVSLLLSSIWVQATLTDNTPANFEAMAHTYNIALLFTRSKTSSHMALVRCFQLAFSLRRISLDQEGCLQPSRRRSLFTLASSMLIFSARAGNLPELIPIVKSSLTDAIVDPYLRLVDNIKLRAAAMDSVTYGSEEDDLGALHSLSTIESDEQQLKETVLSHLISKFQKFSEDELSRIRKQLLQDFSPDESYPLGAAFMETPEPCSPLAELEFLSFDEALASTSLDEVLPDASGSHSGRRTSMSSNSQDILSVNQLLESVLETAQEVASLPASASPLPYDQVKDQCEALVTCKQQKMSVLSSFEHQQETKAIVIAGDSENKSTSIPDSVLEESEGITSLISTEPIQGVNQLLPCSLEYEHQSFRLPPASPYEKFLKAAGC